MSKWLNLIGLTMWFCCLDFVVVNYVILLFRYIMIWCWSEITVLALKASSVVLSKARSSDPVIDNNIEI